MHIFIFTQSTTRVFEIMNRSAFKRVPLTKVYQNLYPWKSFDQFFEQIKSTIAYKSEDGGLIALNKPFGVGTFTVIDKNTSKQNQDRIRYQLTGHPKYCIGDVLESLSQEFNSPERYQVLKGIDRYMSGLVLITNDLETYQPRFKKSINDGKINKMPPYGMRAITCGFPTVNSNKVFERVGMQLIEVDELGDHKEPIIVPNPSKKFESRFCPDKTVFQAELNVKKVNREYSAALIELYISKLRWDFARCYISSKTSFILGDVRFSKRIREILGRPIQISAINSSHRCDDNYEPLNRKLLDLLGVYKNASIPLMLDLHAIRLKGFDRTQKSRDLFIQSPYMPVHFALTAGRLNLLDDDDELSRGDDIV